MQLGREEVNDAIQRLVSVVGMQCRQTQVTGFGKGHGMLHGFLGAHLANQNHVRRLPQGILQGNFKRVGIDTHFTLSNNAVLVLVNKFDRVFDRNDVTAGIFVAITNHGRQ